MISKIVKGACTRDGINLCSNTRNYLNTNGFKYVTLKTSKQHTYSKNSLFPSPDITKHRFPIYDISLRKYHRRLPKTPDLIYVPHIARWVKTKLRFKILQRTWDPEFTEGSFIYGTTRAVCRITEIIHDNKPEQLNDLLTTSAKIKLMDDMSRKLTKTQKIIIKIKPDDIKILVPMSVNLNRSGEQKLCRVAMRVLALKWIQQNNGILRLVLIALQTEFLKDYTFNANSDWNISAFDILECAVLNNA